jgi:hypothetical protein
MQLQFLTPGDDRWRAFLEQTPHDFYHLPGYVELTARQENGQGEAVLATAADDFFFLPYVVRSVADLAGQEDSRCSGDICSPYGYPGPLVRGSTVDFLRSAVRQWTATMRERQIASGFFRFHPLFSVPAGGLNGCGSLTMHGQTVSMDLTLDEDVIWRSVRRDHQMRIKQLRKKGFQATVEPAARSMDEFISIYQETMDRVGAATYYYFPPAYYEELSAVLGERLWIGSVRQPSGEIVASALFIACGPIVQYHLSGTRTAALALAPTKLLLDHGWRWARARGCRVLHLGGGVGSAEDSLFHFKAGFSDRRHPYHTWQVVFLEDIYEKLTLRRRAMASTPMRPGYFPAYRA